MTKYISTRGDKTEYSGASCIIQGLAPDKGLFVPTEIPRIIYDFSKGDIVPYRYAAYRIMRAFFDDFTEDELLHCVDGAYDDKFDTKEIAPLARTGKAHFLELYHGRTAAFKDMALSILPYLLTASIRKEREDKKIVILTATSGDTGKAALEGFSGVPGTDIFVFYPKDGVSEIQERQMVTQRGANTHVYAIDGNFDDAQTAVKSIFNDTDYESKLAEKGYRLSSANSINIGRLVPQIAYYYYAYAKLAGEGVINAGAKSSYKGGVNGGDKINIVVPTGNFGNILAAWYARESGLPVNRLICASNENRVLTDFINDGVYDANRKFVVTSSPSMDILISSNLERLLWHLSGGDSDEIAGYMKQLDADGRYTVSDKVRDGMNEFMWGGSADMQQAHAAIGKLWQEDKYLIDTHTAVAYSVYLDYLKETGDNTPAIIASTASAYKFADKVAGAIGLGAEDDGFAYIKALNEATGVTVPEGLRGLDKKKVLHEGTVTAGEMPDVIMNDMMRSHDESGR